MAPRAITTSARFAGRCRRCGETFPAGATISIVVADGARWSTVHHRCALPETMSEAEIRGAILALDLHCSR